MESGDSRAIRKPAWQLPTRLLGLALVLSAGPWLAAETERPSKAEARQIRAEIVAVYELQVAGHLRDSIHAKHDFLRKWKPHAESIDLARDARFDAELERLGKPGSFERVRSQRRQAAADFLSSLPANWPQSRSVVLPTALAVVGLALLVLSYRSSRLR